jgi:hypothetical protein
MQHTSTKYRPCWGSKSRDNQKTYGFPNLSLRKLTDQGTMFPGRRGSGNVVPRLPQILPAKVTAAEFALVLSMMAGAIIAAALRVAVIHVRVKPFARGVAELLVSHSAKRHATLLARLLVAQNGVVFFTSDVGALKPDEFVVFRMVYNHLSPNRVIFNIMT